MEYRRWMARLRRWAKRIGIFIVALLVALTLASLGYNAATNGEVKPATALYPGPFVRIAGRLIAYRSWGHSGTPVILVGGFGVPSFVWDGAGPRLAQKHRVYALDLPPFGYSERKGPYTLAAWVDLVHRFAIDFGLRRPVIVGHSLGAAVAVGTALWHPRDVRGIVLLDGDAIAGGGAPGLATDFLVSPWYTSVYRLVTSSDWIVRRALKGAFGKHVPRLDGEALEPWERPFKVQGTAAAFRSMLRYGIQGFHLSELARVRTPVTVVWGADDTVDGVSAGRASANALKARFRLIRGAGHLSMIAAPRAVARAIDQFAASASVVPKASCGRGRGSRSSCLKAARSRRR
jgi:pimeloyl-ACP methyl ester carboxylesterase